MMGDGAMIWFLVLNFNGLQLSSVEPFNSEEACRMAGRVSHLYQFECVSTPAPQGAVWEWEREST